MKKEISASEMKALLVSEFARLAPPGCKSCKVPMPYWGPSMNAGPGFWYLETPAECSHGCRQVIVQLWASITTDYEIGSPRSETVS